MAATAATLSVPTHVTLAGTLTTFIVPAGTRYVYMYADADVTFEVQLAGSDPDGNAVAGDAYFTWPSGKHDALELGSYVKNRVVSSNVYFSVAGAGANLEIAFLPNGL